jgi:hypothetical protein
VAIEVGHNAIVHALLWMLLQIPRLLLCLQTPSRFLLLWLLMLLTPTLRVKNSNIARNVTTLLKSFFCVGNSGEHHLTCSQQHTTATTITGKVEITSAATTPLNCT